MKKLFRFVIALILSGIAFIKPAGANATTSNKDITGRINAVRESVRKTAKTPEEFQKLKIFDFSNEPMAQFLNWVKWPNWNNWGNWNNWHNWPNFHNWHNWHDDRDHDRDHDHHDHDRH
jgi:hypothetical protein